MPRSPGFRSLRAAVLIGALSLPLAACAETGPAPLSPEDGVPASVSRAPATDAELAARQVRERGPGARTW